MTESKAATTATRRHAAKVADRTTNGDGERYELLGELATGGMATVYLGRMRRPMGFARLVAIKCMHPQYAKDPSFASMFLDEARLTARLRHPNIVPTLDIVADGGHLLIVMEYVEGESLAGLFRLVRNAEARIPVAIACAIIHDLLLGLHEAHEARDDDGSPLAIIHRDVSPQNVIVGLDGLARVLDFGVARARSRVHQSNEGEIKGKIPYMPPEQLFGESIDRRVDVYAAGVLLWEALVGQRLFDGSHEESLVRRIDAGEIAAPSTRVSGVSPELDALVLRALRKGPEDRFPTALAMAEVLSSIAALPPRTEISAWMKRFATPRSVPADAIGTTLDLASASVSPDELVAVLERATVASRSSLVPISAPIPRTPQATSRFGMAAGVAAFALSGILVGRAMRAETAHAESAHHAAPPAGQPADPVIAPPSPLEAKAAIPGEPVPTPAAKAPARKSGKPVAATSSNTTPAAKPEADVAALPVVSTPDLKPTSCRLPYVVDAEGHRHYKVECL